MTWLLTPRLPHPHVPLRVVNQSAIWCLAQGQSVLDPYFLSSAARLADAGVDDLDPASLDAVAARNLADERLHHQRRKR